MCRHLSRVAPKNEAIPQSKGKQSDKILAFFLGWIRPIYFEGGAFYRCQLKALLFEFLRTYCFEAIFQIRISPHSVGGMGIKCIEIAFAKIAHRLTGDFLT